MSRIYVLGSAGEAPTSQRQTSSYLIETRRGPVFLGAGTGIGRLVDPLFQEMLEKVGKACVLLPAWTHDLVGGLSWLPHFLGDLEVTLGVPKSTNPNAPSAEATLNALLSAPFVAGGFDAWRKRFAGGLSVHEFRPGRNRVGGERVEVAPLDGQDPRVALRVRECAMAVGGSAREETAKLAAKASVLIHDAGLDRQALEEHPELGNERATAEAAARLAAEAQVQDLMLGHLNPSYDPGRLERLLFEASAIFPRTVLAADMMVFKMQGVPEEVEETAAAPEGDGESAVHGSEGDASTEGEVNTAPGETENAEAVRPATEAGDLGAD